MNYRHAFHAGNHADVLKHVVLLAMVEAFKRKAAPFFALDTHAGRGRYLLQGEHSDKTGEARAGIFRLLVLGNLPRRRAALPKAVQADNPVGALVAYPARRCCWRRRCARRTGWWPASCSRRKHARWRRCSATTRASACRRATATRAVKALLPPKEKRGLVLIDPPYEAQEEEFPRILGALAEGLQRWPTGCFAVWYPIKQRRTLPPSCASSPPALQVDAARRTAGARRRLAAAPERQRHGRAEPALQARPGTAQAAAGAGQAAGRWRGAESKLDWLRREGRMKLEQRLPRILLALLLGLGSASRCASAACGWLDARRGRRAGRQRSGSTRCA
jgi:23S rRNA (adenine2030-N6)-methyltransferase